METIADGPAAVGEAVPTTLAPPGRSATSTAVTVPEARPRGPTPSGAEVIKTILGLVVISVLAYLGGHPSVRRLEQRLRISNVIAAGFIFVALGLVARHPAVGVLSNSVLREIRPILPVGLGWLGFTLGFRFDARGLEALGPRTALIVALTTSLPFAATALSCGVLLLLVSGSPADGIFLRNAIILGTAGAMTAPALAAVRSGRIARIVQLEELAGVFGLTLLAAFFRPSDDTVGWHLPATAWIFITLGMATAVGAVIYAIVTNLRTPAETLIVLLGSICFTAGMASYLRLSPIAVCFLVGLLLNNFPGTYQHAIKEVLEHMERPVYLIFLVIAGALWRPEAWQGWALLVLFVAARLVGKWLSVAWLRRRHSEALTPGEQRSLSVSPVGSLAIAVVVNAQDLYFDSTISWIVTAVIGGAVVTEVIVQIFDRGVPWAPPLTWDS